MIKKNIAPMIVMILITRKILFDEASEEDYYKPISAKNSFKKNYKYYESRGDK